MNGPETLHLIRRDLQRAVARRGEPTAPQPMDALSLGGNERHAEGYSPGTRRPGRNQPFVGHTGVQVTAHLSAPEASSPFNGGALARRR